MLPDPTKHPTVPLWPDVGRALGLKRQATYDAYHRGELPFPVWKIGPRLLCPTAHVLKALGLARTGGDGGG